MSDINARHIHGFGGRATPPYCLSEEAVGSELEVMKKYAGVDAIIVKADEADGRCRFSVFRPAARAN